MNASMKPYLVGIAGGSASGKTSLLRELRDRFPQDAISIISQDNYYVPKDQQQTDENGQVNFDLPTSINRQEFYNDMLQLRAGRPISRLEYTFNNAAVTPGQIIVEPAPIVVVEGLFVFYYEEIREMLDLKVYLDARDEIKLGRRIARDARDRGYSEEMVRYQWDNHVMPAYYKYLRPFREETDIVIPNNTSYQTGLEVLVNHLKAKVPQAVVQ